MKEKRKIRILIIGIVILTGLVSFLMYNKIENKKYAGKIKVENVEVKRGEKEEKEPEEKKEEPKEQEEIKKEEEKEEAEAYSIQKYIVKYTLKANEKIKRNAIVRVRLSEEEIKYISFVKKENEKVTSEIKENGKVLELKIKDVETNEENAEEIELKINNAPDGFKINPVIEVLEETSEENKKVASAPLVSVKTTSIEGIVRDKISKEIIKNEEVILYKIENKIERKVKSTYSDEKGKYVFSDLEEGSYKVKSEKGEVTVEVKEGNTAVDIESEIEEKFSASIKKYVNKITIIENNEEKEYEYKDAKKAVASIKGNKKANIKIEYKFVIENTSNKKGYVKVIKENIPEGFKKVKEEKNWIEEGGILYNKTIGREELSVGEKKEIKLTLESEGVKAKEYINKVSLKGEEYHTVKYVIDSEEIKEITVVDTDRAEEIGYEREGVTLEGWYKDKEYEEKFDFKKPIEKDTVIYGKIIGGEEVKVHYVDIDKEIKTEVVKRGEKLTGPKEVEEEGHKKGHTFKYWSLEKEGKEYNLEGGTQKEITLYAVYEKNTYKVEYYDIEEKEYVKVHEEEVKYKEKLKEVPNLSKKYYDFKGWETEDKEKINVEGLEVEGNLKLYAVYEEKEYEIEFYDKEEKISEKDKYKATEIINEPNKEKEHYIFKGWYTKEEVKIELREGELTYIAADLFEKNGIADRKIKLYAKYEKEKYEVSFIDVDPKTNEETVIDKIEVEYQDKVKESEKVVEYKRKGKEGYQFKEWIRENSEVYDFEEEVTKNIKIYSSYTRIKNGIIYDDENRITEKEIEYGEKAEAIEAKGKEGYIFKYWSEDKENAFDFNTPIKETKRLYAVYEITRHELRIEANGGEYQGESTTYTLNYNEEKKVEESTKEGYTFIGYKVISGNGEIENLNFTMKSEDTVLEATYRENTYKVRFKAGTGQGEMEDQEFRYTEVKKLSKNAFTKEGYQFKGWKRGEERYQDEEEVYSLGEEDEEIIELEAEWEANTYKVVYKTCDEEVEGTMEESEYTYDETGFLRKNTYTKQGYDFKGWTREGTEGIVYEDEEEIINISTKDKEVIELCAVFEAKEYTIKYEDEGEEYYREIVKYNETAKGPKDSEGNKISPKKEYKEFIGWYLDEKEYNFETVIIEDLTLHAKYKEMEVPEISQNPSEWTNGDVEIEVSTKEGYETEVKEVEEVSEYRKYENKFSVSENKEIKARYKKSEEYSREVSHVVKNIDKELPELEEEKITVIDSNYNNMTLGIKTKDNESRVKKIKVYIDENNDEEGSLEEKRCEEEYNVPGDFDNKGEEEKEYNTCKLENLVEDTTYKVIVEVEDFAGNKIKKSKEFKTNIIVAEIVKIENDEEVTEENTIPFSSVQKAIEYCEESACKIRMIKDESVIKPVEILENQNITLNLNGKTIRSELENTMINRGTLQIIEEGEEIGGVQNRSGSAIRNSGRIIIGNDEAEDEDSVGSIVSQEKPYIKGGSYGIISDQTGNLKFYDGKIEGVESAINGEVNGKPYLHNVAITSGETQIATLKILQEAEARVKRNQAYYTKVSTALGVTKNGSVEEGEAEEESIMNLIEPIEDKDGFILDTVTEGYIKDLSGNNNNGLLDGATVEEGKTGINFNGGNFLHTNEIKSKTFTYQTTFKHNGNNSGQYLFKYENLLYAYIYNKKDIRIRLLDYNDWQEKYIPLEPNIVCNLSITYDGQSLKAYFNGEEVWSYNIANVQFYNEKDKFIIGENFGGTIYDFKAYNRALSSEEIKQNSDLAMELYKTSEQQEEVSGYVTEGLKLNFETKQKDSSEVVTKQVLTNTNKKMTRVDAQSYIKIDLTNYDKDQLLTLKDVFFKYSGGDYSSSATIFAAVTDTKEAITKDVSNKIFYNPTGTSGVKDYTRVLEKGKVHYLHLAFQNASYTNEDILQVGDITLRDYETNREGLELKTNGEYGFIYQEDGTIISNNPTRGWENSAQSYIEFDLTEASENQLIAINAELNTVSGRNYVHDSNHAIITINDTKDDLADNVNGNIATLFGKTTSQEYRYFMEKGKKYYLHLAYFNNKNTSDDNYYFKINYIKLNKTENHLSNYNVQGNTEYPLKESYLIEDEIIDLSDNNYNATNHNSTYDADKNALLTTDGYIDAGLINTENMTLEASFYYDRNIGSQYIASNYSIDLYVYNNALYSRVYYDNTYAQISTPININEQYTVQTTYDGSNLKLYLNGELKQTGSVRGNIKTTTNAFKIGANYQNNNNFLGNIYSIRLYDRALTEEELQTNLNEENKVSDGIKFNYEFQHGKSITSTGQKVLKSTNQGTSDTLSQGYIEVDLTNEEEDKYFIINVTGSNQYNFVSVDNSSEEILPENINNYSSPSGSIMHKWTGTATTRLEKGKVWYIHIGYKAYSWSSAPISVNYFDVLDLNDFKYTLGEQNNIITNKKEIPKLNEEADTVELLKNIDLTDPVSVENTRNVVLDLRGYTLGTNNTNYIIKNYGNLEVVDSKYDKDLEKATMKYNDENAKYQDQYNQEMNQYNEEKQALLDKYNKELEEFRSKKDKYYADLEEYKEYLTSDEYKLDNQVEAKFGYTGDVQEFVVPFTGRYKLETWGAQGGSGDYASGGKGAYSKGEISLTEGEKIYIYVGESPKNNNAGYNGGGKAYYYGGGGATDIRYFGENDITEADLEWNSSLGLASRIMVSGGGGSSYNFSDYWNANGGEGGTLQGLSGTATKESPAQGGTQTSGGLGNNGNEAYKGKFGLGGSGADIHSSAGGGGYYGGGGTYNLGSSAESGAGGSSYISGYEGAVAVTSETDISPRNDKDGNQCTDLTANNDVNCSYHYSGKIFIDTEMKAGNEEMPTHDGSSTMTGNEGNGYAKITFVDSEKIEELRNNLDKTYDIKEEPSDPTETEEYKISKEFSYTGDVQEFIAPDTGNYNLEVWGAQGGYRSSPDNGGKGGYSKGTVHLEKGETIYIYVGGSGNTGGTSGGFNGGGPRDNYYGGGGATDIRIEGDSLYNRVIVAGGGGSDGASRNSGGAGGGVNGIDMNGGCGSGGNGATQTSGNALGQGGRGRSGSGGHAGAGGGGWYGGYGSSPDGSADDDRGGGGGSGFAYDGTNIVPEEYAVTSHVLTDTQVVSGNEVMPTHDGADTMIGNTGNGHAKITFSGVELETKTSFSKTTEIEMSTKNFAFDVNDATDSLMQENENGIQMSVSYANNKGVAYYNSTIILKENDEITISGSLSFSHNYGNNNLGEVYVGISRTKDIKTDDFIVYNKYDVLSTTAVTNDFNFKINEPGEYYFKVVTYHNDRVSSNTVFTTINSLNIHTEKPILKGAIIKTPAVTGNITSSTNNLIYNNKGAHLKLTRGIININKSDIVGIRNDGLLELMEDSYININSTNSKGIYNLNYGEIKTYNNTINLKEKGNIGIFDNSISQKNYENLKINMQNKYGNAYDINTIGLKIRLGNKDIDNLKVIGGAGKGIENDSKGVITLRNSSVPNEIDNNNGDMDLKTGTYGNIKNNSGKMTFGESSEVYPTINSIDNSSEVIMNYAKGKSITNNGKFTMNDGIIETSDIGIKNNMYKTFDMHNGIINSNTNENAGIFNMHGGTINAKSNGFELGIKSTFNGFGGNLVSKRYGFINIGENFYSVELFNVNLSNDFRLESSSEAIKLENRGQYTRIPGANVSIKDNVIIKANNLAEFGSIDYGTFNVTVGEKDQNVDSEYPKIQVSKNVISASYPNLLSFSFYDGRLTSLKNQQIIKLNDTEEEYELVQEVNTEDENLEDMYLSKNQGDVAEINGEIYHSLKEAFDYVNNLSSNDEVEIKLLKNISTIIPIEVNENKNVIFNLNGFKINELKTGEYLINNGTLKIVDSSSLKTDETFTLGSAILTLNGNIVNNNNLLVEAGTYNFYDKLINNKNMTINNGSFNNKKSADNSIMFDNKEEATITINAGTYQISGLGIAINNNSTLENAVIINNGSFSGDKAISSIAGLVTINEGTFSSSVYTTGNGRIKVVKGTFNSSIQLGDTASGEIEAGTINTIYVNGESILNIRNGNITALNIYGSKEVNIYNGTVNHQVLNMGALNMYNGNLQGGISNRSGAVMNIYDGFVRNWIDNQGTLTMYGGEINSSQNYHVLANSNGILTILGGKIISTGTRDSNYAAIGNTGSTGVITIGTKGKANEEDAEVVLDTPEISSTTFCTIINRGSNVLNYYDGILKGPENKIICDLVNEVEENYSMVDEVKDGIVTRKLGKVKVAKVGETEYETLDEAFADSRCATGSTCTIELLQNVSRIKEEVFDILEGQNITLDLNGHSITNKYNLFNVSGNLTIDDSSKVVSEDSVTLGSGSLGSTDGVTITNNETGNVRQIAGAVTGTGGLLLNNKGSYILDNGNITSPLNTDITIIENSGNASFTVNDGNITKAYSGRVYLPVILNTSSNEEAIVINGGTLSYSEMVISSSNGKITINNGDIKQINSNDYKSTIETSGNALLEVNGGSITGDRIAIRLEGPSAIINSGYVSKIYMHTLLEVNGGTISNIQPDPYYSNPVININNGEVNYIGSINGAYEVVLNIKKGLIGNISNIKTVNIGTKGDLTEGGELNVSTTSPEIRGSIGGFTELNFYDGVIKSNNTAINGNVSNIEEGYTLYKEKTDEYKEVVYLKKVPLVEVEGKEFYTINEAIESEACNTSCTIKYIYNQTGTKTDSTIEIPESKNIILDINGHTITTSNSSYITNNGTLKIIDEVAEGKGSITASSGVIITNKGSLEIDGGILNSQIYNTENGQTTITSGTITNVKSDSGSVILNSGTIQAGGSIGVKNEGTSTFIMNGGLITNSSSGINNNSTGKIDGTDDTIQINGGTIDVSSVSYSVGIANNSDSQITINNVENILSSSNGVSLNQGTFVVNDGKIKSIHNGYGNTILKGGTISNNLETWGTLSMSGGSVQGTLLMSGNTATITGGTINNLNNSNGTTEISGVTINNGITNASNLTINNSIVYGGITNTRTLNIINSEVRGSTAITNNGGVVTIGTKGKANETDESAINAEKPLIEGEEYGLKNNSGTVNIYDGVLKGQSGKAYSGVITEVEPGYMLRRVEDGEGRERTQFEVIGSDDRTIGLPDYNLNFTDMQAAINSVTDNVETKMYLYQEITLDKDIVVPSGKIIKFYYNGNTINKNGHTFTVQSGATFEEMDAGGTSLLGEILELLNIGNKTKVNKNIVVYELEDGSKLNSGKEYKLQVLNKGKYVDVDVKEKLEDTGRYEISNTRSEESLRTINGNIYINKVPKGDYRVVETRNEENKIEFSILEDGNINGNVKENYQTKEIESENVLGISSANVILNIQTGQKVIRYGGIILLLSVVIGFIIILKRKLRN